jgi:hypothetical protein
MSSFFEEYRIENNCEVKDGYLTKEEHYIFIIEEMRTLRIVSDFSNDVGCA